LEGGSPLSLGRPSEFVGGNATQLASLPLIDPQTGDLVAMSSVVFTPEEIWDALREEATPLGERGLHVLVATKPELNGDDTVMSPELLDHSGTCGQFANLLVDCDASSGAVCHRSDSIERLVDDMRAGKTGQSQFDRVLSESGALDKVSFTFAPVNVTSFRPVDPSNFSRGVEAFTSAVYSLGLGRSEESLRTSYENLSATVGDAMSVLILMEFTGIMVILYATVQISVSVTKPVTQLFEVVRGVNRYVHMLFCCVSLDKRTNPPP